MGRLADVRLMTVADADAVMEEIATLTVNSKVRKAEADARILAIKSAFDETEAMAAARMKELRARLASFILDRQGDREVFGRNRARKTNFGRYGLHIVTSVEIEDETTALATCESRGLAEAIKTTRSLVKAALAKLVTGGEDIPGVRVASGDEPFVTVDAAFLRSQVEEATR